MSAIAARLGGSKATLYGYFASKEALFAAVIVDSMEELGYELVDMFERDDVDLRRQLLRFGEAYLKFLANPDVVGNSRTAIGAAMSSNLGAQLYELGATPAMTPQEAARKAVEVFLLAYGGGDDAGTGADGTP